MVEISDIAKATSEQTHHIGELTDKQLEIVRYFADSAAALSGMTHRLRESIKQMNV